MLLQPILYIVYHLQKPKINKTVSVYILFFLSIGYIYLATLTGMIDSFTCNNISLDLVLKVPLKIIIYKSMSSVLGTTDILSVSFIIE